MRDGMGKVRQVRLPCEKCSKTEGVNDIKFTMYFCNGCLPKFNAIAKKWLNKKEEISNDE